MGKKKRSTGQKLTSVDVGKQGQIKTPTEEEKVIRGEQTFWTILYVDFYPSFITLHYFLNFLKTYSTKISLCQASQRREIQNTKCAIKTCITNSPTEHITATLFAGKCSELLLNEKFPLHRLTHVSINAQVSVIQPISHCHPVMLMSRMGQA